jgi:hypothetical protein
MSRIMQENVKNITDIIWEDVRINWVENLPINTDTLKTWTWNISYYLAKLENNNYISNHLDCTSYKKEERCILVREKDGVIEPLVNSWVAFEDLKFYISSWNKWLTKVTMNFTIRPATWKWISVEKIKKSKIILQTTFSQRIYKYK